MSNNIVPLLIFHSSTFQISAQAAAVLASARYAGGRLIGSKILRIEICSRN